MGIANGQDFETVYQDYLAWFWERARPTANPKEKEEVLGCQIFHEDIFENDDILLNRMYFLIPLSPSQSKSGALETFRFSELNLMLKIHMESAEEITDILPVQYRRE